jgi:hypothetical protein
VARKMETDVDTVSRQVRNGWLLLVGMAVGRAGGKAASWNKLDTPSKDSSTNPLYITSPIGRRPCRAPGAAERRDRQAGAQPGGDGGAAAARGGGGQGAGAALVWSLHMVM